MKKLGVSVSVFVKEHKINSIPYCRCGSSLGEVLPDKCNIRVYQGPADTQNPKTQKP